VKIPLHPGTHLNDIIAMRKLRNKWVCSNESEKASLIKSIYYELEFFGDCYKNGIAFEDNDVDDTQI